MPLPARQLHAIQADVSEAQPGLSTGRKVKTGHFGYWITSGKVLFGVGTDTCLAGPGDIIWIGGGLPREIKIGDDAPAVWKILRLRHRFFTLGDPADQEVWTALQKLARPGQPVSCIRASDPEGEKVRAVYSDLWETRRQEAGPRTQALLKAAVIRFVLALEDFCQPIDSNGEGAHGPALFSAMRYLEDHYEEPVSMDEAARVCGMGRSRFYSLFLKGTGMSPGAYLLRLRLSAAERLLVSTNLNITEVAMNCGFGSMSRFYQAWNSHLGGSPARFRRQSGETVW